MIFHTKATQKNVGQKLTDISLTQDKSNQLWSELEETSEAAVIGGNITPDLLSFVDTQEASRPKKVTLKTLFS